MLKTKNEILTQKKMMVVPTNILLWDYLLKGNKLAPKFTRCEAFYDLIKRQTTIMNQTDELYINGSIRELAMAWRWDRETVSRFLSQLTEFGLLMVGQNEYRASYTLKCSVETLNSLNESSHPSACLPLSDRPSGL